MTSNVYMTFNAKTKPRLPAYLCLQSQLYYTQHNMNCCKLHFEHLFLKQVTTKKKKNMGKSNIVSETRLK